MDIADAVSSGGGSSLGVSELAENFGKDCYVDINGWRGGGAQAPLNYFLAQPAERGHSAWTSSVSFSAAIYHYALVGFQLRPQS